MITILMDGWIVVEGQITDKVGPSRVKVSKTFPIDQMQLYSPAGYGAEVQIFGDKANLFPVFYPSMLIITPP